MHPDATLSGAAPEPNRSDMLTSSGVVRGAILVGFALLVVLSWTRNVNWDEFYFLSLIHDNLAGRLETPMQTFHVHAFGWLAHVPGNEMMQIFVARLCMTGLFTWTAWSIHRIATHLCDRRAADIAVLAFLTSGFALAHGTSFRADPIAAACLMGALSIMMTGRMSLWQIITVAILSALALLVTIKAALYLPAFLGALVWRSDRIAVAGRIVLAGMIALAITAGLFALHVSALPAPPEASTVDNASAAASKTLVQSGFFPRSETALLWAVLSLGPITLAAIGMLRAGSLRRGIMLVSFALPLLASVIFYRNAFPYFFPYIVPPLMVVVAFGAMRVGRGPLLASIIALSLVSGTWQGMKALGENAGLQRATIAEVHRLFPEPVHYIDHNAMISTFPRELFFMSSWGIESYHGVGEPVMAAYLEKHAPPLLLTNRWALHQTMTASEITDLPYTLLPDDQAVLRASYVHYSGTIWLAGLEMTLGSETTAHALPIPGRYRLESPVALIIDGRRVSGGDIIEGSGVVTISGPVGTEVRLIWHTDAVQDEGALPHGWLYAGFWRL
ncbi:hypothetical protein [Ruegeria sp. SCP11]|uniref:hypothetical protein n=1 Tax=Ruegeria sp. SCP11 TaxID=3141378 RepID=UPI003336649A